MRMRAMNLWRCQIQSMPAPAPRKISTDQASDFRSPAANGRIAAGSILARPSKSPAWGFKESQTTVEMSATFITDLKKLTRPSRPNSRLNPESGDTLERSGFRRSVENRNPDWITLPATPLIMPAPITTASTGRAAVSAMRNTTTAPPSCSWKASGRARKGKRRWARSRQAQPPAMAMAPAVPASEAQEAKSADLATSPRLRASSRRLEVGSSVREDGSVSSATGVRQVNMRRKSR